MQKSEETPEIQHRYQQLPFLTHQFFLGPSVGRFSNIGRVLDSPWLWLGFCGGRKFIGVFKSLIDCWLGVWGMFQGDVGKFLDATVHGSEIPNNNHCLDGAKPIVNNGI